MVMSNVGPVSNYGGSGLPNSPGVTPAEYLNSGEKIVLETRPSFWGVGGLAATVWFILSSILFFTLSVLSSLFLLIWLLLSLLPFIIVILRWRRMFYTLTDQRILMGSGIANKKSLR